MKIHWKNTKSQMYITKGRVSGPKDLAIEIIQDEKRRFREINSVRLDWIRWSNIHIIGTSEGKERQWS